MAKVAKVKAVPEKAVAPSGPEQVASYFSKLDHPLKKVMESVREIILSTNKEITEHIKWNAPSFCIDDDDRITFNLYRNECVLLVFHRGAKVKAAKAKGPLLEDTTGLLQWITNDRATIKLFSEKEVKDKKHLLKNVVKEWIAVTRD